MTPGEAGRSSPGGNRVTIALALTRTSRVCSSIRSASVTSYTAVELMLNNLIDNAIRYSDVRRSIAIRAHHDGAMVAIEIGDRGVGISEDEIPHVVRRFVRGRRSGSGGSGLGLAIANRIAADHGGKLTIRSAVDVGTTVTVMLPVAESDA